MHVGGGGGFRGAGGGGYHGGGGAGRTPSLSRPAGLPSSLTRPSGGGFASRTPSLRPAYGNLPTPGPRPGGGFGGRPGGVGIANRPSGVRPGMGTRPSTGIRPGVGTLPAVGGRPSTVNMPNFVNLPTVGGGFPSGGRPTTRPISPGAGLAGGALAGGVSGAFLNHHATGGYPALGRVPGLENIASTLPARPGGGIQPGGGVRLVLAQDQEKEFGPAAIDRELIDQDNLVMRADQPGQVSGPAISVGRADPVIDRRDRVTEDLYKTVPIVFPTGTNGSNRRIGGRLVPSPCSRIGIKTAADMTNGMATNGGL